MKISWSQFAAKFEENENVTFEILCTRLFERTYNNSKALTRFHHNPGIETEPIFYQKQKTGFQAKFFDNTISTTQLKKSIRVAAKNYPDLNQIIIYTNKEFAKTPKPSTVETEAKKYDITIKWIFPCEIEYMLTEANNIDLAQTYFHTGDEINLIQNSVNKTKQKILNAPEYIPLNLVHNKVKTSVDDTISAEIGNESTKMCMICGHPGAGKSVIMHKFLHAIGGIPPATTTKTETIESILEAIGKYKVLPIYVNLNECHRNPLETVIHNRLSSSGLSDNKIDSLYLLDGLDELSEHDAQQTLKYLQSLIQKSNTKKIVLSCRSGNRNRLAAKTHFPDLKEYLIADITNEIVQKYFQAKSDTNRQVLLENFTKQNLAFTMPQDILSVTLLWETIEQLTENSTPFSIIEAKVELMLKAQHKTNIDNLNLPVPKSLSIFEINKQLSFKLSEKMQFRITQQDLQQLIFDLYPQLDYHSVNEILDYQYSTFSDADSSCETFIYQHRRYQEYFFAHKLKDKYEENLMILREIGILSDNEFMDTQFFPLLRTKYKKDICKLAELNLLQYYYIETIKINNFKDLARAFAMQSQNFVSENLNNTSIFIHHELFIDQRKLIKCFDDWKKNKTDKKYEDILQKYWNSRNNLLVLIKELHEKKHIAIANTLLRILNRVDNIYENHNFFGEKNKSILSCNENNLEEWFYVQIVICSKQLEPILNRLLRPQIYENHWHKEFLRKFFKICLKHKSNDAFLLFEKLSKPEKIIFLEVLCSLEFLPMFVCDSNKQELIKKSLPTVPKLITTYNCIIFFYKKYLCSTLSPKEQKALEQISTDLIDIERINTYASVFYGLFSFEKLRENKLIHTDHHRTQLNFGLKIYAALWSGYIQLLKHEISIEQLIRDYLSYVKNANNTYMKYVVPVWVHIFMHSKTQESNLKILVTKLFSSNLYFMRELNNINTELFQSLFNEGNLLEIENKITEEHFESRPEIYFDLAQLYAHINKNKAQSCIIKGCNENIARHGFRKDSIITRQLLHSFEILCNKNWIFGKEFSETAEKLTELTLQVLEISDGAYSTQQGPDYLLKIVANMDIQLAEQLQKKIINKTGYSYTSGILQAKIALGEDLDIEKELSSFTPKYDYLGNLTNMFYEETFIVYLAVTNNFFYTDETRKKAFAKAYEQIQHLRPEDSRHCINYILPRGLVSFKELCETYSKPFPFESDAIENSQNHLVDNLATIKEIEELYQKLLDGQEMLKSSSAWNILLDKTHELTGSINLFINLLKAHYFPHDWFSKNSPYFHEGVAIALKNINTRSQMQEYIYSWGAKDGYDGYYGLFSLIKIHALNNDKDICLKLFKHFFRSCQFLVY